MEAQNAETNPVQAVLGSPTEDTGPEGVPWTLEGSSWHWHERKQENKAWRASSRSFFNIPKSSLSPKGTKKAQSFPKSQGCSKVLVWACTQALQGSVPGLGQPLLSTPLFPLPETQHFQGLASSMAPFYTRVWLLSALLSVIVSWVIKQSFLTESWRSFCPTSPTSLHLNTAFLLAIAPVSFPLLLF